MQPRPPEPIDDAYVSSLLQLGRDNGLEHIGIASAEPMSRALDAIRDRVQTGLSDSMQFTFRNPERSTDPGRAVRGARAMIVAARSYVLDEPEPPEQPYAMVGRYAWVDHYAPLREGLWALARRLRHDGYKAVPFADDNSVVDREAAFRAGLGWFGKNANLLLPGAGSFFVLGSVVTTAPLPEATQPVDDGCGACQRCIDGCPTGAIVAPGVIDAGRCLAWLLQRPGTFPHEHRVALGMRIYGCDECQVVCPPAARSVRLGRRDTAVDPAVQAFVPLLDLLEASDQDVLQRHGRWYLADRNVVWLRRNALVALGNWTGAVDGRVVNVLRTYTAHADPMLREHAEWSAGRLGLGHLMAVGA